MVWGMIQLLCTDRSSQLKQLYRLVMDRLEAHATACASLILVNSGRNAIYDPTIRFTSFPVVVSSMICLIAEFTANVFRETFPRVYRSLRPQVL